MKSVKTIVILMVFLDALFLSISWVMAYWLRYLVGYYFPKEINPFEVYLYFTPVMVSGWIITCALFGLYRRTTRMTVSTEFVLLVKASLLGFLVSMSLAFLFKDLSLGRSVLFFMGGLSFIFLSFSRFLIHGVEKRFWEKGLGVVNTLVVGAGASGIRAVQKLQDSVEIGYLVVGFVDNDENKWGNTISGVPVLGGLENINDIIAEYDIEDVFFAIPKIDHNHILDIISSCPDDKVSFHIVTDVFDVISEGTVIEMLGNFPVVDLKGRKGQKGYEFIKRIMDLVIAISGIVITSPLWLMVMLWIKLDSKGPVFFRQKRVGKDGREFDIIKFRTMSVESESYARSPEGPKDNRITRAGKSLRRLSIDELPQLLNVISGDMSIVGPRPEMPFIVKGYKGWEMKRLMVKPGITGLWQVIGRKDLPLEENIQYDFFYIKNRSVIMDISILLRTIPVLFSRRGAY